MNRDTSKKGKEITLTYEEKKKQVMDSEEPSASYRINSYKLSIGESQRWSGIQHKMTRERQQMNRHYRKVPPASSLHSLRPYVLAPESLRWTVLFIFAIFIIGFL